MARPKIHGHHGTKRTPTYNSWRAMKARCLDNKNIGYANYGGRGIKICKKWMKFTNFLNDMGVRPEGKTLDRIDNDRSYTPENCRWATPYEQTLNRNFKKTV